MFGNAQLIRQLSEQLNSVMDRLTQNDLTIRSLIETQKKTDEIISRMDSNDSTIRSLIETQKKTEEIISRMDSNDSTIRSLIETQKKTDEIVLRMDRNDLTTISLIRSQQMLDEHLREYADDRLKLITRTEKLAEIILDMENDDEIDSDFWSEDEFVMLDKRTYSQTGEDSIIAHIVANLGIPFDQCSYLDLGANNPKEMSNTYFFYSMGATGVLVEANPYLAGKLKAVRSRDIVLNKCVSRESGEVLPFNIINIDGLSALGDVSDILEKNPTAKIEKIIDIESISVKDIIGQYFHTAPVILNVDIEGMEMEVFSSIDFDTIRPLIIICEMIPYNIGLSFGEKNKEILSFLNSKGYSEYAFTGINSIFIDKNSSYLKGE